MFCPLTCKFIAQYFLPHGITAEEHSIIQLFSVLKSIQIQFAPGSDGWGFPHRRSICLRICSTRNAPFLQDFELHERLSHVYYVRSIHPNFSCFKLFKFLATQSLISPFLVHFSAYGKY